MAFNLGGALSGGLGGAATGAGLGSIIPGIGTAIGAGAGGLLGLLGGLFGGGGASGAEDLGTTQQIQRFTPEQQEALTKLLQAGLGGLGEGMDFGPIEEQARTQFEQRTIPGIAERFAGLDALQSGAFRQSLGQAGAGLESQLAAQKAQFGMQRQGQLQNLLQLGLQPQFETIFQPRQPGILESAVPGIAGGLAQGFGQNLPMLLKLLGGGA
jgi:hypothetical protein